MHASGIAHPDAFNCDHSQPTSSITTEKRRKHIFNKKQNTKTNGEAETPAVVGRRCQPYRRRAGQSREDRRSTAVGNAAGRLRGVFP